jgi:hypothetical protein
MKTAAEVLDTIAAETRNLSSMLAVLEDGEALAALQIDDQDAVEEAHAQATDLMRQGYRTYWFLTCPEIMEAIWYVAGGNSERAEEIWRDGGTEPEMIAIEERATNNGGVDKNTLYWGASGNAWYLV